MLLKTAIDDYLETVLATKRPRTYESANLILCRLKQKFGDREFAKFTGIDLTRYLSELPYSNRTKANIHIRVGAMLRHHDVEMRKFKSPRPRFTVRMPEIYDERDLNRFFAATRDDIHAYVYFKTLLMTGLRDMESMWMEWTDLKNGMFHVRAKPPRFLPKTHEERQIPVPKNLATLLNQMPLRSGTLIFPTKSGLPNYHGLRTCKRIAARAGLDPTKWSLHGFRRTFCTSCLRAGLDVRTVMLLMGHKDIDSTLRYWRAIEMEQLHGKMSSIFAN
jgi:integrase